MPRRVEIDSDPIDVAQRLRHLPGFLFLWISYYMPIEWGKYTLPPMVFDFLSDFPQAQLTKSPKPSIESSADFSKLLAKKLEAR